MIRLRYLLPLALLGLAVVVLVFRDYPFSLPSAKEEAARFASVKSITLIEFDKRIEIDDPNEIRKFMAPLEFERRTTDCQCMYASKLKITTDSEVIDITIGPHGFWVEHPWDRINVFRTPPKFFGAYEAYWGREPDRPSE